MIRRRDFLSSIVAATGLGLAGCTTDGSDDSEGGTNRGLAGGGAAAGQTSGSTANSVYSFDDDVSEATQKKVYRVDRRLESIVGRRPRQPTRITTVEGDQLRGTGPSEGGFSDLLLAAQHVDPETANTPPTTGLGGRRSEHGNGSQIVLSGDDFRDSLVAHELFHVIQDDVVESVTPADRTRDGRQAAQAVGEGAAEYVEWVYDQHCRDGSFDPCTASRRPPLSRLTPALLGDFVQPYFSGMHFVHAVYEQQGWSGVWDLHRSPPGSTVAIVEPERYLSGGVSLSDVSVSVTVPDDWIEFESDRVGVFPLFTKLFSLGIASLDGPAARATDSMARRTGWSTELDSSYLKGWQGDQFVGYGDIDDGDRMAYAWAMEWDTRAGAEELTTAVERAYDDNGERLTETWRLGDTVVSVDHDETLVTFTMAPDRQAHEALFGTL